MYQIERALPEHPVECQSQHRVDEQRHEHDQPEPGAIEEHHAGGQYGHRTVDQRRDQALGQQVADRLDGAEAGHQIAHVPALEERERQAQQMREQPAADIEGKSALQVDQDARAQQPGYGVEQHGEPEAEGEHPQQAAVVVDDALVNRELHVEGPRQHIGLQDHRQHQRLYQRRGQATRGADQIGKPLLDDTAAGLEAGSRRDLERHASEMVGDFARLQPPLTECRILNDNPTVACHAFEHHEMAHVPVQDRRQPQSRKTFGLEAQWPPHESDPLRRLDDADEGHALQRNRIAAAQAGKIGPLAVVRRNHRETGETAFGRFGLANVGNFPSHDRMIGHADLPRRLRTGSRTQSSSDRRSNTMSAFNVMSAPSGNSRPNASMLCRSSVTATR